MFGLDSVVFRPHNVYGIRQNTGDRYRNVIGIFMNQLLQNQPCSIFGDGEQTRAFTHVSEVAPVIARCVDVPAAMNQVFNIGADKPTTVNRLAEVVQEAMGKKTGVVHLPPRKEVVHAFSDHSKVSKVFGHTKPVTLEEGIREMAEWVKKVGPRKSSVFQGIEVERNLPPSWRAAATS